MKAIFALLITLAFSFPIFAITPEAGAIANKPDKSAVFLREFDITFWQTLPFAAFWGYLIASQTANRGATEWKAVIPVSVLVSAANAALHAGKVGR